MPKAGDDIIFTGSGALCPQTDGPDDFLDVVASIRDEYLKKRQDALDQMELHAAQGDTSNTSLYSTEAERHAASAMSVIRVLKIGEAFFSRGG